MFYLVGSRFFGTHREDSDWDFFGADTASNRVLLERLGLKQRPTLKSGDIHYWGNYRGRWLDVVLTKALEQRIHARDVLARLPGVKELTKFERYQKIREITHHAME